MRCAVNRVSLDARHAELLVECATAPKAERETYGKQTKV